MDKKISRRDLLTQGTLYTLVASAAALAAPQTAAAKISKRAAGYQNRPRGRQKCANCRVFYPRSRTCKLVSGRFSPNGWCRLWR